jgi:hypothetical protein
MLLFRRNHTIAVIEPERPGNEAAPEILAGDGDLGPVAIMRHLHDDVSLEEGLTVRDLFECLAPFGPVLSLLGELDFDAWLDEVRQPASGPSEFSYIELHRTIDLMKQPRVDVPVVHDDSWCVRAVLGKPHEDEYMRQQVTSYGIDFLPGRRLANLPVVVAETGLLREFSDRKNGAWILSGSSRLVRRDGHRDRELVRSIAIDAHPTFLSTIVRGFLYEIGFYGTPSDTSKIHQTVLDRLEKAKAEIDGEEPDSES